MPTISGSNIHTKFHKNKSPDSNVTGGAAGTDTLLYAPLPYKIRKKAKKIYTKFKVL
jgi:hypothetical protein